MQRHRQQIDKQQEIVASAAPQLLDVVMKPNSPRKAQYTKRTHQTYMILTLSTELVIIFQLLCYCAIASLEEAKESRTGGLIESHLLANESNRAGAPSNFPPNKNTASGKRSIGGEKAAFHVNQTNLPYLSSQSQPLLAEPQYFNFPTTRKRWKATAQMLYC